MEDTPFEMSVGFPEMWEPVYGKYELFFEAAVKLAPIATEIIKSPVKGPLLHTVGRMAAAAANTLGALLTLALNGYSDAKMQADMAPSWEGIDIALSATGCAIRSIGYYDDLANLGFKERIEKGPLADYLAACKRL